MLHGCTEPSSTLHPYAFATVAHKTTDAIGANANATIGRSASTYQSHGNLVCGVPFIIAIPNHRLQVNGLTVRMAVLTVRRDCDAIGPLNEPLGSALILSAGDRILRSRPFTSRQQSEIVATSDKVRRKMRRPARYKRALPAMNAIIIPGSSVRTYWSCWITACFRAQSHSAENSVGADLCVDSKCARWSATREHRSIEHGLQASVTNPSQTRLESVTAVAHMATATLINGPASF